MRRGRFPAAAGAALLAGVGAYTFGASGALAQMRNQSVLQSPTALPAPIPLLPPRAPQPMQPQPQAPGQYPTPYAPAQPYMPAQPYPPAQPYNPAAPPAAPGPQDLLQPAPEPSPPGPEQAAPSAPPTPEPATPSPPVDQTAPPVQSGWVPKQIAELRALDKVDAAVTQITIKVGQSVQYKSLTITLRACAARPADQPADSAAFLDIVDSRPGSPAFHGWVFAHDPSISMLQHPVYDVQLASCHEENTPVQPASAGKPDSGVRP